MQNSTGGAGNFIPITIGTGNLVAYGCKVSFEKGYGGVISFIAKTQLIEHYQQTLGAKLFGGNRMFIDTSESFTLVKQYFKDFSYGKL